MTKSRRLPTREQVFIESLVWHGYRQVKAGTNLKLRVGYVIPATRKEDSEGIDVWVKPPNDTRVYPVQITQRGIKIYRRLQTPSPEALAAFIARSAQRVRQKERRCRRHGIAFVLVRDHLGLHTNPTLAWGDRKALLYGLWHLKRRLS